MSDDTSSSSDSRDLWHALSGSARDQLETRSYAKADLATRLATSGVEAGEIVTEAFLALFAENDAVRERFFMAKPSNDSNGNSVRENGQGEMLTNVSYAVAYLAAS